MKNKITPLVFLLLFGLIVKAQNNCSTYYPLEEGATFEYTNYNKKNKVEGKVNYTVVDVNTSGSSTSAIMKMKYQDEKGEELFESEYGYTCEGNVVTIDFESLISEQMLSQFKDMEMEVTGTNIELPNNLSVGQELPDANVSISMSMGGINMDMNVDTVNRKVEKKESITTPAGTFECVVIYSETKTKMMLANKTFPNRIWLTESIGMVKQENYNKNGKLMNSSVLTAYSN